MAKQKRDLPGPLERQARAALAEAARASARLAKENAAAVAAAAEALLACFENGGTVYFCGNGGSAADSQHLAAEFAGRYLVDRPGLPAVALTTNSSAVTAIGNDYGYADVFSRQLEGLGSPGDVLVAITTSGGSESVRRAVRAAHALGMTTVGMTGAKGSSFAALCDIALVTPHDSTPHIQEGHITMGHAFCLLVERAMFGDGARAARKAPRRPGAKRRPGARRASDRPAATRMTNRPAATRVARRASARRAKGSRG